MRVRVFLAKAIDGRADAYLPAEYGGGVFLAKAVGLSRDVLRKLAGTCCGLSFRMGMSNICFVTGIGSSNMAAGWFDIFVK